MRAVCMAPSFGNMIMLTVSPQRPQIPPNHAHHGSVENNLQSIATPPFWQIVTIVKNIVPIVNDTSEAINGETTD